MSVTAVDCVKAFDGHWILDMSSEEAFICTVLNALDGIDFEESSVAYAVGFLRAMLALDPEAFKETCREAWEELKC